MNTPCFTFNGWHDYCIWLWTIFLWTERNAITNFTTQNGKKQQEVKTHWCKSLLQFFTRLQLALFTRPLLGRAATLRGGGPAVLSTTTMTTAWWLKKLFRVQPRGLKTRTVVFWPSVHKICLTSCVLLTGSFSVLFVFSVEIYALQKSMRPRDTRKRILWWPLDNHNQCCFTTCVWYQYNTA